MIRLFVADDHPVVVQGIERFATCEPDLEVVGTAGSVSSVLEAIDAARPDVLSLDVQMPGMRGPRTVEAIASRGIPVLLFTLHPIDATVAALVVAGAQGFLPKSSSLAEYLRAVRAVAAGDTSLPEPLRALLDRGAPAGPEDLLTPRELAIFGRLARCETPKEVAYSLGLSQSTVYTHLEHIRRKLGVRTLPELVRYATSWDLDAARE